MTTTLSLNEGGLSTRPVLLRKEAILVAACEQFARHGFRGASLRDIARDADVSLTLLNHHFGSKARLLSAVVAAHRPLLRQREDAIRRLRTAGSGACEPGGLVRAWTGVAFDTAVHADGGRFLRLLARMMDDAAEEAAPVRDAVVEASAPFVAALSACYPHASRRAALSACLCVDAALSRLLTSGGAMLDDDGAEPRAMGTQDRERIERFLIAGIEAALSTPALQADASNDDDTAAWVDAACRTGGALS